MLVRNNLILALGMIAGISLIAACDSHSTQKPDPAATGNVNDRDRSAPSPEANPAPPSQGPSEPIVTPPTDPARDELADYDWHANAVMTDVPAGSFTGENYGSPCFQDILSRAAAKTANEPATTAHETLHGLQATMRQKTDTKDSFIYYRDGQGLYILDPADNLADVKNHVGASFQKLAKANYDFFLVNQLQHWKNTNYLMDEWASFVAGARTAIEAEAAGKWTEQFAGTNADPIKGLVALIYFNSASLLSINGVDADYLKTNGQFKAAYAMLMEESMEWIKKAKATPFWETSEAYARLDNLQKAADAAPVRAAIKELMGEAWAKRVLGI